MVSETIAEGLDQYRIGAHVRALRTAKNLGLTQLGEHTDLSPGMLSRIETGQLYPTLPTLLRIAMVFGVGLEHFFAPDNSKPAAALVRKADRLSLPATKDATPQYFFESLNYPVNDRPFEAFHAEFVSTEPNAPHDHPGTEMIFLIEGALEITHADDVYVLAPGDVLQFDASAQHSYRCASPDPACAVVIVAAG